MIPTAQTANPSRGKMTLFHSVYLSPGLIPAWQQELSGCSTQTRPIKNRSASRAQGFWVRQGRLSDLLCLSHSRGRFRPYCRRSKGVQITLCNGEVPSPPAKTLKKKKETWFCSFFKCQVYYDSSSFILLLAGSLPLRLLKY